MLFNLRDVLVLFSGFLGILLAAFLIFSGRFCSRTNRILSLFLVLQALALLVTVLFYGHHVQQFIVATGLFYLENILLLLEAFVLYWYCKELLSGEAQSRAFIWRHLAVIVGVFGCAVFIYLGEDIFSYINLKSEERSSIVGFAYLGMHLGRFLYVILCLNLLWQYRQRRAMQYSNLEQREFTWLTALLVTYACIRGTWLLINAHSALSTLPFWHFEWALPTLRFLFPLLDLSWFAAHIVLLYFGFQYSSGFEALASEKESNKKSKRVDDYTELAFRLAQHMDERQPYTSPYLKIDQLASEVSIPVKTLSTMLNQHFETNFCNFVNQYRVKAAADILRGTEAKENITNTKSIIDIAYSVGFNSKATFNRAFKQHMGCTPLAYRSQIRK